MWYISGMKKIAVINGPNLNLLGLRETEIYGIESFDSFHEIIQDTFSEIEFQFYQSNVEGELINFLHQAPQEGVEGVVINPGGYSHTSVALADAISAVGLPTVEVHISNLFAREPYRHTSLTGAKCIGSISGFGLKGYILAVRGLLTLHK